MARLVVYNKSQPDELCHYGVKGMKWGKHLKAGFTKMEELASAGGGGGGAPDEEEEDPDVQDELDKAEKYKQKAEEYSAKAADYRVKELQYRNEASLHTAKAAASKFNDKMTVSGKKQSEYYTDAAAKSIAKANKMEAKAIKYDKKASKAAKKGKAWTVKAAETKRLKARSLDGHKKSSGEQFLEALFGKPRY